MNKDFMLVLFVSLMSVGANLPDDYVALSGVDRKYLLAGLLIVVTIALVRYSKFAMVLAVIILAAGANLPQDIASSLNIDPKILMFALGAIIVLSLANRIIKLPSGLDKKQGFNAENDTGTRALFRAIAKRRIRIVRTIVDSGTNIESRTAQGFTPLMIAAAKGYDEIVRLLLNKGADVTAVDGQGRNAMQIAKQAGRKGSVIMLRDASKLALQSKIPDATQFWWQASRSKSRASA